jgi:stearoyl-CoA desaturase (delta-9 desaturase)
MMGESYHNNHHKYGSRPNFGGIRWHEIDPTFQVIRVLAMFRVIRITNHKEIKLERTKNVQKAA